MLQAGGIWPDPRNATHLRKAVYMRPDIAISPERAVFSIEEYTSGLMCVDPARPRICHRARLSGHVESEPSKKEA